jgi:KaiC/GvpD/RAD55 family RecA-like ATPase
MGAPLVLEHPSRTIESAADFLKRTDWIFQPAIKSQFGAISLDQLDDQGEQFDWLVSGWLSSRDRSVLAGDSKAGKSFFALELALCIAFGRNLFGLTTKRGGVIYQVGEGLLGFKKRLRAWRAYYGVEYSREVPFRLFQRGIDIYRDFDQVDALIEEIKAHAATFDVPLRLVVIDTLAKASIGADENAVKDMGIVMRNVERINEKTGCHVMLVHHLTKGGIVRGSTSVYAGVDQVLLLDRDEATKLRTLTLDKQKDDVDGISLTFELEDVVLGTDEDGRQVTSCVCMAVSEKDRIRREEELRGMRMSVALEVFVKAFFEAEKRYGMPIPPGLDVPPHTRSVAAWEDVKRVYGDMAPSDALTREELTTEEQEKRETKHFEMLKSRLRRFREESIAHGILRFDTLDNRAYCWWTGKPLRAFPQTQPQPKPDIDPAYAVEF